MAWELTGNNNTNPGTQFLGTTDNQPLVIKTNGREAVRINGDGTSSSKLEIAAQDGLAVTGFQPFMSLRDANAGNKRSAIQGVGGDIVLIPDSFIGKGAALVVKNDSGNVGIGTSNPSSKLEIIAQDGLAVTGFQPFMSLRDANAGNKRSAIQGVDGDIVLIPDSFIGKGAALVVKNISGDVIMNGNLSVAKDIMLTGADCAEDFDIADLEKSEPGTVMVINSEGTLELCQVPYDRKVAGIVSGAGAYKPGIILDSRASQCNRKQIALIGKAFCKVDANYGAVEVGDLLTTSATPGHAMKADDPCKAFGSVIGKALRPLASGQGLIPILIALQ